MPQCGRLPGLKRELASVAVRPPSAYVRRRMAQRNITEAEIDEVLSKPDVSYSSETHADRTVVLGRTSTGRRLKVVVLTADAEHVVTVADRDEER